MKRIALCLVLLMATCVPTALADGNTEAPGAVGNSEAPGAAPDGFGYFIVNGIWYLMSL